MLSVSSKASREWFLDKSNSLKTAFSGITGWSFSWEGLHSLVKCRTTSQLVPPSAKIRWTTWTFFTASQTSRYHTLYLHAEWCHRTTTIKKMKTLFLCLSNHPAKAVTIVYYNTKWSHFLPFPKNGKTNSARIKYVTTLALWVLGRYTFWQNFNICIYKKPHFGLGLDPLINWF